MPRFFAVADANDDEADEDAEAVEEIEPLRVEAPEAAVETADTGAALEATVETADTGAPFETAKLTPECTTGATEATAEATDDELGGLFVKTSRFLWSFL